MKRNLIVAAALCAMAFTACNKPQKGLQEALNSEWNITEADGNAIKTTTGQAPYIGFDLKEGRIYGYSGCNRIMGSIDPKTQKPDFQRMGSTMMACPDMETESKVLAALNKAKDFKQEKTARWHCSTRKKTRWQGWKRDLKTWPTPKWKANGP